MALERRNVFAGDQCAPQKTRKQSANFSELDIFLGDDMADCPIYSDGLCSGCSGEKCEYWQQCQTDGGKCPIPTDPLDISVKWVIAVPLVLALMFLAFFVMVI